MEQASLDSYEDERKPHAVGLIRMAKATGVLMTGGGRCGDRLRRHVAPILARVPAIATRLTTSATPPLRRSYYVRGGASLTGTLAPNVPVDEEGRRLDTSSPGFIIVTRHEPTAEQRFEITRRGAAIIVESEGGLSHWLADNGAIAALVRPDGTVMIAGRSLGEIYTHIPVMSAAPGQRAGSGLVPSTRPVPVPSSVPRPGGISRTRILGP